MRAFLAAAALLLMLPLAGAQFPMDSGFTLTLGAPTLDASKPLEPNLVAKVTVPYTIGCAQPAGTPIGLLVQSGVITMEQPTGPVGVNISGTLTIGATLPDCATTMESTGAFEFHLTASQQTEGDVDLEARFGPATLATAPSQKTLSNGAAVGFQVAYLGLLTAYANQTILEANGPVTFSTTLQNIGNAPTVVRFSLGSPVDGDVALPQEVLIPRGGSATVELTHEGGTGEETFQVLFTPHSAKDPDATGDTIAANYLARHRNFIGAHSPAVGPGLAVALVALAAVARSKGSANNVKS